MPNSATLVQALGAAFCAILCALSGMGGGGMMIGARTAAWSGKSNILPGGGKAVQYIEGNGNGAFLLMPISESFVSFEADIEPLEIPESGARHIFAIGYSADNGDNYVLKSNGRAGDAGIVTVGERYTVGILNNGVDSFWYVLNDVQRRIGYDQWGGMYWKNAMKEGREIALFSGRGPNGLYYSMPNFQRFVGRVYAARCVDRANFDFIPAIDPDGTPSLFEKTEEKYYKNAVAGGYLIAGPEV